MNDLFQLRSGLTPTELANGLYIMVHQTQAIQSSLFGLICSKPEIKLNFNNINDLVSQTQSNLQGMNQLAEALDTMKISEATKQTPQSFDYLNLMDTGSDAYMKADALINAVIANKEGEGFYALAHPLSQSYMTSISAEVERLKATIDSLEKLVREQCK